MARKKFTSLADLESWVQSKVLESMQSNMALENEIKDAMQDAVKDAVYDVYEPKIYSRRRDDGGLLDKRNMMFTYHGKSPKGTISYFENLTRGSDSPVYGNPTDSMNGEFISETIENGIKENFYDPFSPISDPRPFAKQTVSYLNDSTFNSHLLNAFKSGLKKAGLNVK